MREEVPAASLRQQRQQQQRIESFQSITGCCSATAACNFLSRYDFNLPVALDAFYSLSQREQRLLVQQQQQQQQRSSGRGGSHVVSSAAAASFVAPSAAAGPSVSSGEAVAAPPPPAAAVSRRGGRRAAAAATVTSPATDAAERRGEAATHYLRHPPEMSRTAAPAAWGASAGCGSRDRGCSFSSSVPHRLTTLQDASSLSSHECINSFKRDFGGSRSRNGGEEAAAGPPAPPLGSGRQQRGGGAAPPQAAREKQPLQRLAETFSHYAETPSSTAEGGAGMSAAGAVAGGGGAVAASGGKTRGRIPGTEEVEAASAAKAIEVEGLERLSADIAVGLDDVFFLLFAYYCECQVQGRITREEFFRGMGRLGACTAAELQQLVPQLRQRLQQDKALARCVYAYAFTYSLEACQKVLPLDLCEAYWELLLQPSEYALMRYWLRFIREEHSKKAAYFSRDSWLMLFDFMQQQQQQQQGTHALQLLQQQQQRQTAYLRQQQEGSQQTVETQVGGEEKQEGEEKGMQQRRREEDEGWGAAAMMVADYDEEGAWPLVIDEFVEWVRRKAKQELQPQ